MRGVKSILILMVSFLLAFACCLPFVDWDDGTAEVGEPEKRRRQVEQGSRMNFTEGIRQWISSGEKNRSGLLEMAERAGYLSNEERREALEEVLELPEEERREMLAMILLRWLESDPIGSVKWCQSELKGQERSEILFELTKTWAYQDASDLAHWWAENTPQEDIHRLGEKSVGNILAKVDPLIYAEYMEMPRLHRIQEVGGIQEETLPGPEDLPAYAEALLGKVAYNASKPEWLTKLSSARHMPGKSGWNHLFERVAVHWYRRDPEKVDAWLENFSEEAQFSARHWIKDDRR